VIGNAALDSSVDWIYANVTTANKARAGKMCDMNGEAEILVDKSLLSCGKKINHEFKHCWWIQSLGE